MPVALPDEELEDEELEDELEEELLELDDELELEEELVDEVLLLAEELLEEDELLEELELLDEDELEPDEEPPPHAANISNATLKGKRFFFIKFTEKLRALFTFYYFCLKFADGHSRPPRCTSHHYIELQHPGLLKFSIYFY